MKVGFDFGSKNISYAVLDGEKVVLNGSISHNGNIVKNFAAVLDRIGESYELSGIKTFGITGNLALETARVFDPVIASVEANKFLKTNARNIFS